MRLRRIYCCFPPGNMFSLTRISKITLFFFPINLADSQRAVLFNIKMAFYAALYWYELYFSIMHELPRVIQISAQEREDSSTSSLWWLSLLPSQPAKSPVLWEKTCAAFMELSKPGTCSLHSSSHKPNFTGFNKGKVIFIRWGTGLTCIEQATVHNKSPKAETLWNPSA